MAKPTATEQQALWEQRIKKSVDNRKDDFEDFFKPEQGRRWFEGRQRPEGGGSDGEWITVNKIYAHLITELPSLYAIDPYYYIKLKKSFSPDPEQIAQMEATGKVREGYLNYLKEELNLKAKARMAILDAEFSYGVLKVHYQADVVDNPNAGEPVTGDDGETLSDDQGTPLLEPDQVTENERYAITRVHPDDLYWDRDAGPLQDDWSWIGQRVQITRASAERDRSLDARAVRTADKKPRRNRGDESGQMDLSSQRVQAKDPEEEVLNLYEIYSLKQKKWLKVLEGAEVLAMEPQDLPAGCEDHPFCVLRFVLRDQSPYPIPPVSQAYDQQRELNEARTKALVHRKRFNRKYEVNMNLLESDEELDKLIVGEDGTCILVQQTGAINPIRDAPLDNQTYTEIGAINRDLLELMGPSPDSMQVSRADSATEAAIVDQRLEVREGDKLGIVSEWIIEVGRKLDQLVQAHITRDEAVRVVGPSGEAWMHVRAEDYQAIAGEYQYSVNVGASQPRLPQIERSQWLAFLQVMSQFPQLMTSERLMKKMAEMHHIEDENLVAELVQIGQQIMQQMQAQAQGEGGGVAPVSGVNPENPITSVIGGALGMGQGGSVQ